MAGPRGLLSVGPLVRTVTSPGSPARPQRWVAGHGRGTATAQGWEDLLDDLGLVNRVHGPCNHGRNQGRFRQGGKCCAKHQSWAALENALTISRMSKEGRSAVCWFLQEAKRLTPSPTSAKTAIFYLGLSRQRLRSSTGKRLDSTIAPLRPSSASSRSPSFTAAFPVSTYRVQAAM